MIRPQTYPNAADNSGARKSMRIRVLGASNREYANTGDVAVAAAGEAVPNMPPKGSEVVRAAIARTRKGLNRDNGMTIRPDDNAAVATNREGNPKGTRVFGPVARESREFNFAKTVSPAPEVLR
uniref:Large ribosomal subunit protein uL14c n=1 Tax=Selaginella sanguinolenta TaxID=493175 RepID=A0A482CGQ0_9TRAC|nr:ribosomal protein L14 [Selaginella sanguinolenta]QBL76339.1 ribosomal protein L14 [Selaginella sanguinolenta]